MKNLLRYSILSILVLSVIAIGCDKDEDGNGPDKQGLLTAHVWNFDKLTTNSTDQDVQLLVNLMGAFMTGATATFSANGTYTISILGETDSGTWELSGDGKKIIMDKGTDDETEVTIVTLTSDVLEFKESVTDEGLTFDVTYRWIK
jgi:hypothetical protein